jgi:hypothetical protein
MTSEPVTSDGASLPASPAPPRRSLDLHVLVTDPAGAALLVAGDALPRLRVEWTAPERMATAVGRTLRQRWAAEVAILELHGDDDDAVWGDRAPPWLAVVELLESGWTPPTGCRWQSLAGPDPGGAPALRPRLTTWLAEWRGQRETAALRPAWSRPGWYQRASEWITQRLGEQGRPPTGRVEQFTHWEIAAVMRVDTARGPVWFKAVFSVFGHEPRATALLSGHFPDRVPRVLAIDEEEGWLLLDDAGTATVADHPEADADAITRLVECQRAFIGRTDDLRAIGAPVRPLQDLARDLAAVLDDPELRAWVEIDGERAGGIVAWVEAQAAAVYDLGFPSTLVHGDFHPENVLLTDDGPVIIDWSDAAVAHPLVDVMTWSGWLSDHPERGQRAWRRFFDAWADVCPVALVEARRAELEGVTAAYHVVSYAGIVRALEPLRRSDLGAGLRQYFEILERAVPS